MANKIILCNLSDANETIDEEKMYWISDVLEALNVPDDVFAATNIRDFRYDMDELGIEVELYFNGNVDIFKKQWHQGPTEESSGWIPTNKDHLVAQWKEPSRVRKKDSVGTYYEIHINAWSALG